MRKTPHSYKNITPYVLANPVGVDAPIKDLQVSLANISWMEKSFNRANLMSKFNDQAEEVFFPKGWIEGGKDEINLIGLDNFQAYCFWYSSDNESPLDFELEVEGIWERDASLYVWCNLDEIDDTKTYDYLPELIQEVKDNIEGTVFTQSSEITINEIIENPSDIFTGFTVDQTLKQNLYHPYRAFRIDVTLQYYYEIC